jgi:hypothetical protein
MPKKNLLKVPHHILDRLAAFAVDDVVVACVRHLSPPEVANYGHLNLRVTNGVLVIPNAAIPPKQMGKYSRTNLYGRVVVRRDLPKVYKSYSVDAPNWNGSGTHEVSWTHEIFPRDVIAPKYLTLSMEQVPQAAGTVGFTVKFQIDQTLNRGAPDFEADLLYNLNMLQENVGAISIFPSATTLADYANTVRVQWEFLPPGNLDLVIQRLTQGITALTSAEAREIRERLIILENLRPEKYVVGASGFERYFGAKFGEDFVAFENLMYGNALYVMYRDWATLSTRSRIDLLKGPREGFDRLPHSGAWIKRLQRLVRDYRLAKGILSTR